MRQLLIQVPAGCGKQVLEMAQACSGTNLAKIQAIGIDGTIDLVFVHVTNSQVETLLDRLQDLPDASFTLLPTGVLVMQPGKDGIDDRIANVEQRSPIEIFLAGLQSSGSWLGIVSYATVAGVIVWIGLYTNTSYLLVAAMLLAPFAGPAMNTALATARGDRQLLQSSIVRYFAALGITIVTTALLSWLLQQQIATNLMLSTSQISSVSVLLPLAAGAAGALTLVQSDRSSLVSGAATGMLVAASLAPPAGIIGMSSALGRWDLVTNGVFVLLLQLGGINLSAAIVFRLGGLSLRGAQYQRGQRGIFPLSLAASAIALTGLLIWQFSDSPNLQRSSLAQRATEQLQQVVSQSGAVRLVEADVRFTRARIEGQHTLLCVVYVQRKSPTTRSNEQIRTELNQAIQTRLQQEFHATPLVNTIVLVPPTTPSP